MANIEFKGFGLYDGTKEDFDVLKLEDGYINFIRTDIDGENGYIYFNGKKYGKNSGSSEGGGGSISGEGINAGEY